MSASYEFWLTDDAGRRILLLSDFFFASFSKVVSGYGTAQIGVSYEWFQAIMSPDPYFIPDWRLDIWRSPAEGLPLRREGIYLLREPRIYTRESDAMIILEFLGRSPIDLLNRRHVVQYAGSSYTTKTDQIDDMMKAVVREQMLYGSARDETGVLDNSRAFPQYEFIVQADLSLGPSVTKSFADRNVLDLLKDLSDLSLQKNLDSSTNRKIYFDVVDIDLRNFAIFILDTDSEIILDESGEGVLDESSFETLAEVGMQFQTFADLRGTDRSNGLEFSVENGNLQAPSYRIDHFDEINAVYAKGQGEGLSRQVELVEDTTRINASRWNRSEDVLEASDETTAAGLQESGRARLGEGKEVKDLYVTFLNNPGDENTPRSLYGLDWDFGDILKVFYANEYFEAEVKTVYVAVSEDGSENIIGRNVIE